MKTSCCFYPHRCCILILNGLLDLAQPWFRKSHTKPISPAKTKAVTTLCPRWLSRCSISPEDQAGKGKSSDRNGTQQHPESPVKVTEDGGTQVQGKGQGDVLLTRISASDGLSS